MFKIIKISCLLLTLTLLISLTACSGDIENNKSSKQEDKSATDNIGNTMGNLQNHGIIATDGELIYYNNSNGLFVNDLDGGNKRMISPDYAESINVINDWIYYYSTSPSGDGKGLWKVNKDGKELTKLRSGYLDNHQLIVTEDSIYFSQKVNYESDNPSLLKLDINNPLSAPEHIYEGTTYYLNLENGWFYFYSINEGGICKIDIDGNNYKRILDLDEDNKPKKLIVQNSVIYYYTEKDGLCSIKTDGSDYKCLNKLKDFSYYSYFCYNINSDYIYLPMYKSLYRLEITGGELQKLNCEVVSEKESEYRNTITIKHLSVINDNLYFLQDNDDFDIGIYKLNTETNQFSVLK